MTGPAIESFRRWRPLLDGLVADIHPLRLQAAGCDVDAVTALAACPRARRTLARLEWLGGGNRPAQGFAESWPDWTAWEGSDGAVLLSGKALERCSLRLGAALFRDRVAKLVFGRDIVALKAAVGTDAYFFALRQGLLVREVATLSPECHGGGALDLPEAIPQAGRLGLAAWLNSLPDDLAFRVSLKLSPTIDAAVRETAGWEDGERRRWRAAMGRVFALSAG